MGKRMLQDPDQPGLPAAVFNRRIFLGAGAVALGSLGLAACGGSSSSSSSGGSSGGNATGPVTFGSNASDDVPKKAYQSVQEQVLKDHVSVWLWHGFTAYIHRPEVKDLALSGDGIVLADRVWLSP